MKNKIYLGALVLLSCFLFGCQNNENLTTITVSRIVSGQTIEGKLASVDTWQKFRLIGISAPDLQQKPWGIIAKQRLEKILKSAKKIAIAPKIPKQDRYNRQLVYLWHDGKLINEQLIAEGHALVDLNLRDPQYRQRLIHAQEYARVMGYGIWNPKQPMRLTPEEFRQQQRKSP
jgi:micrococcal nuclease